MKEVGRGWQYIVYDLGNGRVRKIRWHGLRRIVHVWWQLGKGKRNFFLALRESWRVNRMAKDSCEHVRKILPLIDRALLGNPKFISATEYEQDKAILLEYVFETGSFEGNKLLLDTFIQLNIYFWHFGFGEWGFKFSINNGVNVRGQVIMLDFGELIFDKEKVRRDIETKRWLESVAYIYLPEGELKDYYAETMERLLTVAKLEESWGKSLTPEIS